MSSKLSNLLLARQNDDHQKTAESKFKPNSTNHESAYRKLYTKDSSGQQIVVEFGKAANTVAIPLPIKTQPEEEQSASVQAQVSILLKEVWFDAQSLPQIVDILDHTANTKTDRVLKQKFDKYLQSLEELAKYWKLISTEKYKFRAKFHGTHDGAVTQLLPRTTTQSYFSSMALLTSNHKPIGVTKSDEKISKAGREYFYHAAKLQLRFNELLKLVIQELTPIFKSSSFISWLTFSGPKLVDRKIQKAIKSELKHLEICIRIFEQTCTQTILETQQEILNKNIDIMCTAVEVEEPPQKIKNQLLDSTGHLLQQHKNKDAANAEITIFGNPIRQLAKNTRQTSPGLNSSQASPGQNPQQQSLIKSLMSQNGASQRSSQQQQLKGKGLFLKLAPGNNNGSNIAPTAPSAACMTTRSGSLNNLNVPARASSNGSLEDACYLTTKPAKLLNLGRTTDFQQKFTGSRLQQLAQKQSLTPAVLKNVQQLQNNQTSPVYRQLFTSKAKSRTDASAEMMYALPTHNDVVATRAQRNKDVVIQRKDTEQVTEKSLKHLQNQLLSLDQNRVSNDEQDSSF